MHVARGVNRTIYSNGSGPKNGIGFESIVLTRSSPVTRIPTNQFVLEGSREIEGQMTTDRLAVNHRK
jgi:hypothetical protein